METTRLYFGEEHDPGRPEAVWVEVVLGPWAGTRGLLGDPVPLPGSPWFEVWTEEGMCLPLCPSEFRAL